MTMGALASLAFNTTGSTTSLATSPAGRTMSFPPQVVVLTDRAQIEVLSSAHGHRIRTLATNVAENRGLTALTVSPSGIIYFDSAFDPPGAPSERIMSVPVSGGVAKVVADGRDPAVSPNGGLLAYIADSDSNSVAPAIIIRDLAPGRAHDFVETDPQVDLMSLSWSPDSRSLSFTAIPPSYAGSDPQTSYWILDTQSSLGLFQSSTRIPLLPGVSWAGYRTSGEGIGVSRRLAGVSLVRISPTTGRTIPIASLPGGLAIANIFDGPERSVQADPSGRYLLVNSNEHGGWTLYRITVGRPVPVRVADRVIRAVWVPQSPNSTSTSASAAH